MFIRHGETEWNKLNKNQGQMDIKLNCTGRKQAEKVAEKLKKTEIEYFVSSDLLRAKETAKKIVSYHDKSYKEIKELREINLGNWEGKSFKEIKNENFKRYQDWLNDPINSSPPLGENLKEFQKRILIGIEKVLQKDFIKNVIITHGGVITVFIATILEMPLINYRKLAVDNTGITKVEIQGSNYILKNFNDHSHLK